MSLTPASRLRLWAAGLLLLAAAQRVSAQPASIAGDVRYYAGGGPVRGVTMELSGFGSTTTDASGHYVLSNVNVSSGVLTPKKTLDAGDGVSALDAAWTLQTQVGLRTFDARQRLACDVSGDGTVSAFDAALILQHTVGILNQFPVSVGTACASDWLFLPDIDASAGQTPIEPSISGGVCQLGGISYTGLSTAVDDQDFVAILFGDCTGNWQPMDPTPTPTNSPVPTATPTLTVTPTSTLTLTPSATRTSSPTASPSTTPTRSPSPPPTPTSAGTPTPPPRQLGAVSLQSGPTACNGQSCYVVQVDCPSLTQTRSATLKVGQPTGQPERGTILFATGFTGTTLWEARSADAARILGDLRAAGFRTVQLDWANNWYLGATGELEGQARLACKPASVIRWVYDNLHTPGPDEAFCAEGHSNGASQVAYAITQYGLADILAATTLESGPNFARIDVGCFGDNPALQALWYSMNSRNNTDWGFGFPNNGTGPCASRNTAFRPNFQEASVAFGNWTYVYPHTMVHFLFGGDDITATRGHAQYYHDFITQAGSPLVAQTTLPNVPHEMVSTVQGANLVRDTLLNECIPR